MYWEIQIKDGRKKHTNTIDLYLHATSLSRRSESVCCYITYSFGISYHGNSGINDIVCVEHVSSIFDNDVWIT